MGLIVLLTISKGGNIKHSSRCQALKTITAKKPLAFGDSHFIQGTY